MVLGTSLSRADSKGLTLEKMEEDSGGRERRGEERRGEERRKRNEVDGVNYVFFMNLSSLPVTTGGRYELRGKLIYRDAQGGAIIMSSKFEADWMKYVGVRATRGAIPPFCVDHVRPPKNIEFRMRPDVRAKLGDTDLAHAPIPVLTFGALSHCVHHNFLVLWISVRLSHQYTDVLLAAQPSSVAWSNCIDLSAKWYVVLLFPRDSDELSPLRCSLCLTQLQWEI
ncbi:Hypothetical predicted protein [Scomber scombrus]|uniref:Uncharacterized protein n=1 Tax=Scomber scombrus TaxID=13677 RepID=A0AAV1P4Z1_SCOSC